MKKTPEKVLILTILVLSAVWIINLPESCASKTLTVPTDYPTINQALLYAADGDVVMVKSGVYNENLEVNKSISIVGQNRETTFLFGEGGLDRGARPVVALATDGASISGFTIESQNYSISTIYAIGVYVQADNCHITGNRIANCYIGVFSSTQSNTEIRGNILSGCLKDAMRFYGGSNFTIADNIIEDNAVSGLALQGFSHLVINNTFSGNYRALGLGASYSVVFRNRMLSNVESGIFLAGSKNILAANELAENKWGVYITPQLAASHNNSFYHNNFIGNTGGVYANESSSIEFWDGGAQIGGNYWSDYPAKDAHANTNGFYDAPYQVYSDAYDNYPLTAPFDTANLSNPPAAKPTPHVAANGLVAYWSFDSVDSSGISLDGTGNNPAILGSTNGNKSYIPPLLEGEYGKALAFDGEQYISVPASSSLEISGEATVDVWVNVQAYKDIPYNNIIVQARRTTDALPNRTFGVAINGEAPNNSSAPVIGAIRGYVLTKDGLNEIATAHAVIELNQWVHVVFTRSFTSGMHIYINGEEQETIVTSGTLNPHGSMIRLTETYIGHDAICTIDELKLSNTAELSSQPIWVQLWFWAIVLAAVGASGFMLYYSKRRLATTNNR